MAMEPSMQWGVLCVYPKDAVKISDGIGRPKKYSDALKKVDISGCTPVILYNVAGSWYH